MYLSAGCLVCAATASLAAYTWLVPGLAPATRQTVSFLPLVSVVLMYTGYGIGYAPIVFILQGESHPPRNDSHCLILLLSPHTGELLPSDMRSLGCGLLGALDNVSVFVAVKTVPELVSGLGIHGAFLLYSCCCLANILISFFVMPETKGLTLEEIEDSYKKRERKVSLTQCR